MSNRALEKKKLSRKDVAKIFNITLVTLHRWVDKGFIPKPKKSINGYNVFWYESEILEFKAKNHG